MKATFTFLTFFLLLSFGLFAQIQRNPVLEECTGTWCQYCPCGHTVMQGIHESIPNAILIGYHGPVSSSDPWRNFPGNDIISLHGYTGYPTAVIDRTSAPISRSQWYGTVANRWYVPSPVSIAVEKNYDKTTRQLNATFNVTALDTLTGDFKISVILLENGLNYPQTGNAGCPGGTNYIHHHVVRAMINGSQGDPLNTIQTWNAGEVLSKQIQYTVPTEVIDDSCDIVALVYKVESTLNMSEIQQAEQYKLVDPSYYASMSTESKDVIGANNTPAQFSAILRNTGVDDQYYISAKLFAPAGWTGEYTTPNGTFSFNITDSLNIAAGDSVVIAVSVNPNGNNGFGITELKFASVHKPSMTDSVYFRNVTKTGVKLLAVDASTADYSKEITNCLDKFFTDNYGFVSRNAFDAGTVDLSGFKIVTWTAGNVKPAFDTLEVSSLEAYLNSGGNLLLTGQDIGADINMFGGHSQFAKGFYNNYLHAKFVATNCADTVFMGKTGDPIANGLTLSISDNVYALSPDKIEPFDTLASVLFTTGGGAVNSIKVETPIYKVVYFGVGLEQIISATTKDTLIKRSVEWLMKAHTVGVEDNYVQVMNYYLNQNYPNPFNPSTEITYSIPVEQHVSLKVYDLMGREVVDLVNAKQTAGVHNVKFNASGLASGLYIYKLSAGSFVSAKKMVILK